jgi:antitoxin component YwqK of YwqJK toxin-antitoxin module
MLTNLKKPGIMKGYIFLAMIALISCSKEVIITEEEIKPDMFYARNDVNPFTGTCKVVFNDTNLLKEKFQFKHGILNGEAVAYYQNGTLRWKGRYQNGFCTGKWEYWDMHGNKIIEAYYSNDTLMGPYMSWYSNGLMKEKGQFRHNSRTGKWINYNETGQIISETIY